MVGLGLSFKNLGLDWIAKYDSPLTCASVTPGRHRPNIWSIDSECKTKN